jgi:hypothetical protein
MATEGRRAVVTSLLIATRWRQVHDDIVGDVAWIAIFRHDHKDHGECKPDLTMIDPEEQVRCLDEAHGQLVSSSYGIWKSQASPCCYERKRDGQSAMQVSRSSRSSQSTSGARTTSDAIAEWKNIRAAAGTAAPE